MNINNHSLESAERHQSLSKERLWGWYAARFSLFAPFIHIFGCYLFKSKTLSESQDGLVRVVALVLVVCVMATPILGFVAGVLALFSTRHFRRPGIFGIGVAGVVLCGITILIWALILIAVSNYARHA